MLRKIQWSIETEVCVKFRKADKTKLFLSLIVKSYKIGSASVVKLCSGNIWSFEHFWKKVVYKILVYYEAEMFDNGSGTVCQNTRRNN